MKDEVVLPNYSFLLIAVLTANRFPSIQLPPFSFHQPPSAIAATTLFQGLPQQPSSQCPPTTRRRQTHVLCSVSPLPSAITPPATHRGPCSAFYPCLCPHSARLPQTDVPSCVFPTLQPLSPPHSPHAMDECTALALPQSCAKNCNGHCWHGFTMTEVRFFQCFRTWPERHAHL